MTNEETAEFQREIKNGRYLHAYKKLIFAFENNPQDKSYPKLSEQLEQVVRKKGYGFRT